MQKVQKASHRVLLAPHLAGPAHTGGRGREGERARLRQAARENPKQDTRRQQEQRFARRKDSLASIIFEANLNIRFSSYPFAIRLCKITYSLHCPLSRMLRCLSRRPDRSLAPRPGVAWLWPKRSQMPGFQPETQLLRSGHQEFPYSKQCEYAISGSGYISLLQIRQLISAQWSWHPSLSFSELHYYAAPW